MPVLAGTLRAARSLLLFLCSPDGNWCWQGHREARVREVSTRGLGGALLLEGAWPCGHGGELLPARRHPFSLGERR